MKIHEYQAKEVLREFGVPTPRGIPCFSVEEAEAAARELGGASWVVKAQIHAGGRGKGGGVQAAKSPAEVRDAATRLLDMQLVTHQTGAQGQVVHRLLVEEGTTIAREYYVGMVIDRSKQRVALIASGEGGMEIEEVAARAPEKIHTIWIDPAAGLSFDEADDIARRIGIPEDAQAEARATLLGLYRAFVEKDAMLAEINPLALTADKRILALDAKFNFDSNALYRHPEIVAYRDLDEEDPAEIEASKFGLSYISLDGN
ncbi:MAG: acetate--CoA ligase family protein, partial [Gallionellaceae bacterium]|nr:acetate--CoA ligase family protein [Gallionellaceae bacterium]